MNPNISYHLSLLAVRISSQSKVYGSGVIGFSDPSQNLLYVITARHCIVEGNSLKSDITVDFTYPGSNSYNSIKPQKILTFSENTESDVAVLIISTQTLRDFRNINTPINLSKSIPANVTEYYFRGFPIGNNSLAHNLQCIYNDDTSNELKIIPIIPVETNTTTALSNVRNFSGSGVWFFYKGNFYLVGIVVKFDEGFGGFFCEKITNINKLFESNLNFKQFDLINTTSKSPNVFFYKEEEITNSNRMSDNNTVEKISYNDFINSNAFDELTNVFDEKFLAHLLLDRIEFPNNKRPQFNTSYEFWKNVCIEIKKGVSSLDFEDLLKNAHLIYPQNRVFKSNIIFPNF